MDGYFADLESFYELDTADYTLINLFNDIGAVKAVFTQERLIELSDMTEDTELTVPESILIITMLDVM